MSTTNFEDGRTPIVASWLNDVDSHVYDQESVAHQATNINYIPDGTDAQPTDVQAKLREFVTFQDFGAKGNGDNDTTAVFNALTAVQTSGQILRGVPGSTYKITTDFVITSPIKIDLEGCVILQATDQRGFLQLRADGNYVRNVRVEFAGTRAYVAGSIRYRGYSRWQRMCAVWVESSDNDIRNVTSKNLNSTLCLRGPVVFNPAGAGYTGSDSDPATAFFYSTLATDNFVDEIHGEDQDFVITGHQQKSLEIGSYTARRITQVQNSNGDVPPHALYMTNPDDVTLCDNVYVRSGHCETNNYGTAHKFIGFSNLNIGVMSSIDTTGGVLFENCDGVAVQSIFLNQNEDRLDTAESPVTEPRYGAYILSSRVRVDSLHVDGVLNLECGGALIDGTSLVDIESILLRSRNPVGVNTAGVVRCEDTSETRIGRITHIVLGADTKESIFAVNSAEVHCASIKTVGTTRVARGDGSSQVFVAFDPQQIDSFDRSTAFVGNVKTSQVMPYVQTSLASTTTVYGSTTAGAHTYTQREFLVIRKGDEVTIYGKFIVNGAFGGTGDVRIGPLPYTVAGTGSSADAGSVVTSGANVTLAAGELLLAGANDGEAFIRLQTISGLTKANLAHTAMGSSARIEFILNYRTTDAI